MGLLIHWFIVNVLKQLFTSVSPAVNSVRHFLGTSRLSKYLALSMHLRFGEYSTIIPLALVGCRLVLI